jgi:hypothetical protein
VTDLRRDARRSGLAASAMRATDPDGTDAKSGELVRSPPLALTLAVPMWTLGSGGNSASAAPALTKGVPLLAEATQRRIGTSGGGACGSSSFISASLFIVGNVSLPSRKGRFFSVGLRSTGRDGLGSLGSEASFMRTTVSRERLHQEAAPEARQLPRSDPMKPHNALLRLLRYRLDMSISILRGVPVPPLLVVIRPPSILCCWTR